MFLILIKGYIQRKLLIFLEVFREDFSNKLRINLIKEIFDTSFESLNKFGRGEILALILSSISRSSIALDQLSKISQSLLNLVLNILTLYFLGAKIALF